MATSSSSMEPSLANLSPTTIDFGDCHGLEHEEYPLDMEPIDDLIYTTRPLPVAPSSEDSTPLGKDLLSRDVSELEEIMQLEMKLTLMLESSNISSGSHGLGDLPELNVTSLTYRYPILKGPSISTASCLVGKGLTSKLFMTRGEAERRAQDALEGLKGLKIDLTRGNSVGGVVDDGEYYSSPPVVPALPAVPAATTGQEQDNVMPLEPAVDTTASTEHSLTPPRHPNNDAGFDGGHDIPHGNHPGQRNPAEQDPTSQTPVAQDAKSPPPLPPHFLSIMQTCMALNSEGNQTQAISLLQDLAIEQGQMRARKQLVLGFLHHERFCNTRDAEDLEIAIACMIEALSYMADEAWGDRQPTYTQVLGILACYLEERFTITQNTEDLDMAIEYMTQVVEIKSGQEKFGAWRDLFRMYRERFTDPPDVGARDLDRAVVRMTKTMGPSGDSLTRCTLAILHIIRHGTSSRELMDLDAAAAALDAVIYGKGKHADFATWIRADVADKRWLATGRFSDVKDAIKWSNRFQLIGMNCLSGSVEMTSRVVDQVCALARMGGDRELLMSMKNYIPRMLKEAPYEGHELGKRMAEDLGKVESTLLALGHCSDPVALPEAGLDAIDPEKDPGLYIDRLQLLSERLFDRFKDNQDAEDLTAAMEKMGIVVAVMGSTEPTDRHYISCVDMLMIWHMMRYNHLSDEADIDSAIMYGEMAAAAAVSLPGGYDRDFARRVHKNLKTLYGRLSQDLGLEKELKWCTLALEGLEEHDPDYVEELLELSRLHNKMFGRTGDRKHIDAAIEKAQRAVDAVLRFPGKHDPAEAMRELSMRLKRRYRWFHDERDLEESARYAEESVKLTPRDHPKYAERVATAVEQLMRRGVMHENERDVEQASAYIEAAKDSMAGGSGGEGSLYLKSRLKTAEWMRDHKDMTPIDALVVEWQEAAQDTSQCATELANRRGLLGALHAVKYYQDGHQANIEASVEHLSVSRSLGVDMTVLNGELLAMLSRQLLDRYHILGASHDLDMSIAIAREAVECTPLQSPCRPDRIRDLCDRLIARVRRNGVSSLNDLHTAITLGQHCADATAGTARQPHCLVILADALILRHRMFPPFQHDLCRALKLYGNSLVLEREAKGIASNDDTLHKLGVALRTLFLSSGLMLAIGLAIKVLADAVRNENKLYPRRGKMLDDLARCYLLRYSARQGKGPDGQRSFLCFREAWGTTTAPPLVRIRAAQGVGTVYVSSRKWVDAAAVYEDCVNLMPQISRPFLSRQDQQRLLTMLTGIASQAATCALLAGKGATHALQLLELGRGIIAGFVINCRSDVTDLRSHHPDVCREFEGLRAEMEHGLTVKMNTEGRDSLGPESFMSRRKKVISRMEQVLDTIRALPGYEGFLRPPSTENLMALAIHGPVVVVNANPARCDAIIVTSTTIKSITLNEWDWDRAGELLDGMKGIVTGSMRTYADRTKKMRELLVWLWDVIVNPILTALGITSPPHGELTKVWWIGTGPLGLAPFHAAGHHRNGSTENTISRIISSYTPNIKALQYSRQKPVDVIRDLLLVSMPSTKGMSDLEGVAEEVQNIADIVGAKVSTSTMLNPSVPQALSSLDGCQAVHFACHGITNAKDPSSGGLVLQDGQLLTVADIAAKSGCATMAYLSACSTAETADSVLVDEGITLAGAFQMAGFRHVIATMWEGRDNICVAVAGGFYENIMKGSDPAVALHEAVVKVRGVRKHAGKVLDWAPFIHNGA